jgi:hypothetical protein
MLQQAVRSETVPGHRGMWIAEELGEEWRDWTRGDGLASCLEPGAVLAAFARDAWSGGLQEMSDEALTGLLRTWRRLASWATAGELAAAAELDRRRRPGGRQAHRRPGAAAEVGGAGGNAQPAARPGVHGPVAWPARRGARHL